MIVCLRPRPLQELHLVATAPPMLATRQTVMARRITTAKRPKKRSKIVRYASLARIPIRPLSRKLIEMSDEEVERRAALDPDAGRIPRGFWRKRRCTSRERNGGSRRRNASADRN